jgi:hypothetical protein
LDTGTVAINPRRGGQVLSQRVAETIVLLDPVSGCYFTLDDVGKHIWELCDGSHDVGEIVASVCAVYAVAPEIVQTDVVELLEELAAEGLLGDDGAPA